MMVCRMESRSRDEVRAFATSWKMWSSCVWRAVSAPVACDIKAFLCWLAVSRLWHRVGTRAMNDSNEDGTAKMLNAQQKQSLTKQRLRSGSLLPRLHAKTSIRL